MCFPRQQAATGPVCRVSSSESLLTAGQVGNVNQQTIWSDNTVLLYLSLTWTWVRTAVRFGWTRSDSDWSEIDSDWEVPPASRFSAPASPLSDHVFHHCMYVNNNKLTAECGLVDRLINPHIDLLLSCCCGHVLSSGVNNKHASHIMTRSVY